MDGSGSRIWGRCEGVRVGRLPLRLPDVGRRGRERAPRFSQSLWRGVGVGLQNETLFSCQAREKGFGRRGGHLSGPAGRRGPGERSWAPREGSPAAAARASRPSLGVSGSSMATRRRRATPLTPHFQIKMAQAPGPGR